MSYSRLVRNVMGLALALSTALPASAQQPVQLTSVGDGVVKNGVYVGHYTLATPGTPSLDVYCVDFLNAVSVGNTWNAHFTPLVAGGLGNTRQGNTAFDQYRKAAWLTQQFALNSHAEWGAIHAAIWVHMLPGSQPTPAKLQAANWSQWGGASVAGWSNKVAYWIARANQEYLTVDPSDFVIITDVNGVGRPIGGKQEYIAYVTPEPTTMLLLGTGLLGTLGAARSRRRRDDEGVADASDEGVA